MKESHRDKDRDTVQKSYNRFKTYERNRNENHRSRDKTYWRENANKEHNADVYRNDRRRDYHQDRQHTNQPYHTPTQQALTEINRNEVPPFLSKIYYAINTENTYENEEPLPKERELVLYLWMNSTLKEITELIRAHLPAIRTKQRFVLSRVSKGQNDMWVKKEMGSVMVHKKGSEKENTRLDQHHFCIGDYIDISIYYK